MLGVVITIVVMAFMSGVGSRPQNETIFVTESAPTGNSVVSFQNETTFVNGTLYLTESEATVQSYQIQSGVVYAVTCYAQTVFNSVYTAYNWGGVVIHRNTTVVYPVTNASSSVANATVFAQTACYSAWTTTGPTQTWTYHYTLAEGSLPQTTFSTSSSYSVTVPPTNSS